MTAPQEPVHNVAPAAAPRRPVLRFLRKALRNWRERHQHPVNFAIHLLGIPLAVSGLFLLFFLPWYWGVSAFILGYALQYAGHAVEGNDVGEWAGIKRMLGLPYVSIAPRWQQPPAQDADHVA
jgi:Protein of unknown function (DUF962)